MKKRVVYVPQENPEDEYADVVISVGGGRRNVVHVGKPPRNERPLSSSESDEYDCSSDPLNERMNGSHIGEAYPEEHLDHAWSNDTTLMRPSKHHQPKAASMTTESITESSSEDDAPPEPICPLFTEEELRNLSELSQSETEFIDEPKNERVIESRCRTIESRIQSNYFKFTNCTE
ncbi:hypothetical protein XU18_2806 [Perkinsela sp. CCAP 1560/4]|nr:hypothetical protein XU18_2806 [Perkinsela sp. CCAP 1560/4]|eukprot:KNH06301.1 hypothetical protein XU18_2806 [Perkinsela sp. CCAP 1560/4]